MIPATAAAAELFTAFILTQATTTETPEKQTTSMTPLAALGLVQLAGATATQAQTRVIGTSYMCAVCKAVVQGYQNF